MRLEQRTGDLLLRVVASCRLKFVMLIQEEKVRRLVIVGAKSLANSVGLCVWKCGKCEMLCWPCCLALK